MKHRVELTAADVRDALREFVAKRVSGARVDNNGVTLHVSQDDRDASVTHVTASVSYQT